MRADFFRSEVSDIMQEIFLSIWEKNKLSEIRDVECFSGWLAVVTINATVNYCRKRHRKAREINILDKKLFLGKSKPLLRFILSCNNSDPVKILEAKEMEIVLDKELEKLKQDEKRALEFNIYGGKKQKEIAEIMKMSLSTVATHISRAKKKVRDGVLEYEYQGL